MTMNGLADLTPQPVQFVRADEVEASLAALRRELDGLTVELADVEAEADLWEARVAAEGRNVAITDSFIEHVRLALESTMAATQVELREARDAAHAEAASRVNAVQAPDAVAAADVVEEVSHVEPAPQPAPVVAAPVVAAAVVTPPVVAEPVVEPVVVEPVVAAPVVPEPVVEAPAVAEPVVAAAVVAEPVVAEPVVAPPVVTPEPTPAPAPASIESDDTPIAAEALLEADDDPHEVFWREEQAASDSGPRAILTGAALPLLAMALLIAAILLWVG
jgi:hypothetical protein